MSSNSWRKYGGKSISVNDTINVGTVVASQFLTRTTSSITNTFDNINVLGEAIIHYNTYVKQDLFVSGNEFISNNLYIKDKLQFGIDISNNIQPYAFMAGNRNNIGINTANPSSIFHITGNATEVLTIDTQSAVIRNIIGQNVNKKGLVVWAQDTFAEIDFYSDYTTDNEYVPNAYLRYQQGGYLSASTLTGIDLSAGYISSHFGQGVMHLDQDVSVIYTPGSLLMKSQNVFINSSNVFLFAYSPQGTPSSAILMNASGILFNTNQDFYINSLGGLISSVYNRTTSSAVVTISANVTDISSNVVISTTGNYNTVYNETLTVYDSSNSVYLFNVYDNSFSKTGNAITMVAVDNSSNTQAKIVTPNGIGLSLVGGVFPNDTTRAMAALQLLETSGNIIPSYVVVSGNDPKKYYSTFGLNTYLPKTENYILDVNGPTRIGNGEINTTIDVNFEIKYVKFSKSYPLIGIAVGTPIPNFTSTSIYKYFQYILYTKDGGITWNTSTLPQIISLNALNTFNSLYVFDQKFAIVGTTLNEILYSYDGGENWYSLLYYNNTSYVRSTNSIIVVSAGNSYQIFSTVTYTSDTINPPAQTRVGKTYISSYSIPKSTFSNNIGASIPLVPSETNVLNSGNNPPSEVPLLFVTNDGDGGSNTAYFVGSGGVYETNVADTGIARQILLGNTYYGVYVYNDATNKYVVAVGRNIISWTTNGGLLNSERTALISTWSSITLSSTSVGNVTLKSVYIYDLSNAVAVGDNGVFVYSTNWSGGSWNTVPSTLLNSSGIADRLTTTNLRSINMYNFNSFIISNVNQPYNAVNKQLGQGQIMYCYFPNLFNRANNKVFDVSGNMFISGDININDSGQLFSNNSTFNILRNTAVNQIYVGNNAASTEITGNLFVRNDVSLNSRLFVYGDASYNSNLGILGNITLFRGSTLYGNNYDISTSFMSSSALTIGNNATNINIGPNNAGGKTIIIGTGGPGVIASAARSNNIYIGARGDTIVLDGSTQIVNIVQTQFTFPLLQLNTSRSEYAYSTRSILGSLTPGTNPANAAAGIAIRDFSNNFAGYMLVSSDASGYYFKAPGSTNVVDFNIGSLTLPTTAPLQLNINNNIQNGILVLTKDTNLISGANYGITVKPIDISNVMLRSNNSSNTYQEIETHVGVAGDISLNGRLLIQGDVSFNNRLYLYSDASFCNRLFVNNDVSFGGSLFVANSLCVDTSGNQSLYNFDVSGTSNFRGTIMPISMIDNSVLLTTTDALDLSNNFGVTWMQNVIAPIKTWTSIAMSANGMFQTAVLNSTATNNTGGGIYLSNNYGVNWVLNQNASTINNNAWNSVALSSDGSIQVAVYAAYIYISTSYGNFWPTTASYTASISPTAVFNSVAISGNGQFISAISCNTNGVVLISSNWGISFTPITLTNSIIFTNSTPFYNNGSITMSTTGQYQVCCFNTSTSSVSNSVWVSNNYGQYWSQKNLLYSSTYYNDALSSVCISSSGKYICIARQSGTANIQNLFISSNFGASFNVTGPNGVNSTKFNSICISANGQYIAATAPNSSNPLICYSVNYGSTWSFSYTPIYTSLGGSAYQCISMSANGQYLTTGTNGYIYNSVTPYVNMSISNKLIVYGDVSFNSRLFLGGPVFQF
jgi:hypothetical protein